MSKIPAGYSSITPHIVVDNVREVISFYKEAFAAEEKMIIAGEGEDIMYAEIIIGNSIIGMSEPTEEWGGKSAKTLNGSPISFYVYVEDIESFFNKAKNSGMAVKQEIQPMFWGDKMGTLTDKFMHEWTIAENFEDVSPEELEKRRSQIFS